MRPMIRRLILACAIVFGFLSLVRADFGAVGAAPPNQSPTTILEANREHGRGDHPRFKFKVGHRIMQITVPGSVGETRPVDVHLWYPADPWDYVHAPRTEYTSALNGVDLVPALWDPLSWTVASSSAREGPSIFRWAPRYPVIVFSHGNTNVPIDYALTLEDLAGAGFVVAAPTHVNNSQDDVRIDFVNAEAVKAGFQPRFACLDGRPSPCSRLQVHLNMPDRVRDITYALDKISVELENRVDLDRVGVFGHSRGTVTALTAAGGSTAWNILSEARIKAVMGMAIGAPAITFNANISSITQPTLLVSGSLDTSSPPSVSEEAFALLPPTTEKAYVKIENAVHRTFDSTYCQQMQSSAAIAQGNSRALLDRHTASRILIAPMSGVAMDFCGFATFTSPTDVRPIVKTLTSFDVTETNVPMAGLTAVDLRPRISEMAITFFEHTIGRPSSRWHHFQDDFPIGWLIRHHSDRNRSDEYREADERCLASKEC